MNNNTESIYFISKGSTMKKTILFAMLAGISWAQISSPMKIGNFDLTKVYKQAKKGIAGVTKGAKGVKGVSELPRKAKALFQSILTGQAASERAFTQLRSNLQELNNAQTTLPKKAKASNDILKNLVTLAQSNKAISSAFKNFLDAVAKVTQSVSSDAASKLRQSGTQLKKYATRLHSDTQRVERDIGKVLSKLQSIK